MNIIIRRASREDIPRIAQIEKESFSLPWSEKDFNFSLTEDYQIFLAAEIDGQAEGYAVIYSAAGEAQLANIACSKAFRRSGVASLLLERALEELKDKCDIMFLEVRASNYEAQKLYNKFGFEAFSVRKGYYDNPKEDALIMRLALV